MRGMCPVTEKFHGVLLGPVTKKSHGVYVEVFFTEQ
jgi:hypothetical protein